MRRRALRLLCAAGLAVPSAWAAAPEAAEVRSAANVEVRTSAALSRIFARFDRNGDGLLSKAEWGAALRDGQEGFLDTDKDGSVDRTEFATSFLNVNSGKATDRSLFSDRFVWECQGLLDNGFLNQALESAAKAVESYPECADIWTLLARGLEKTGRISEARHAYARARELAPDSEKAWVAWANFSQQHESAEVARSARAKALSAIESRLAIYGHGVRSVFERQHAERLLRGLVAFSLHVTRDPRAAQELLDWGLKRFGRTAWLVTASLEARAQKGERKEALAEVERLAREGFAPASTYSLWGRFSMLSGRINEAVDLFRQALKDKSGSSEQTQETNLALYKALSKGGHPEAAAELMRTQLQPLMTSPAKRCRLARQCASIGQVDLAISQLRAALEYNSKDPIVWMELASLLGRAQDADGRRQALVEALGHCGELTALSKKVRLLIDREDGIDSRPPAERALGGPAPGSEAEDSRKPPEDVY